MIETPSCQNSEHTAQHILDNHRFVRAVGCCQPIRANILTSFGAHVSPRDALILIIDNRFRIVALALLAGIVATVVSFALPKSYTSEAKLAYVRGMTDNTAYIYTKAELVKSTRIAEAVAPRLNPPLSTSQLLRKLSVVALPPSYALAIRATDTDPNRAAAICNEVALQYVRNAREDLATAGDSSLSDIAAAMTALEAEIDGLRKRAGKDAASTPRLAELEKSYAQLTETRERVRRERLWTTPSVSVASQATASRMPSAPHPLSNGLAGLLGGAMVGCVLAGLGYQLRSAIWSADEVRSSIGGPMLAAFEASPAADPIDSEEATRLMLSLRAMLPRIARTGRILVTSPGDEHIAPVATALQRAIASSAGNAKATWLQTAELEADRTAWMEPAPDKVYFAAAPGMMVHSATLELAERADVILMVVHADSTERGLMRDAGSALTAMCVGSASCVIGVPPGFTGIRYMRRTGQQKAALAGLVWLRTGEVREASAPTAGNESK